MAAAPPRDNWMGATGVAGGSLRAFPFLFNLHVHLTPRAPQCLENAPPPLGRRSKLHRQDTVDGLGHPIPESRQLGGIAVPNASPDRPPPSWIALPRPAQGRLVGHLHPATPSGPPTQALEVPGYAPISPSSHPPEPPTHGFGRSSGRNGCGQGNRSSVRIAQGMKYPPSLLSRGAPAVGIRPSCLQTFCKQTA